METVKKKIDGPSPLSFVSGLKAPYPFYFNHLMKQYGDLVNCGFNIYLVSHPDLARHCFNHDLKNYARRDLVSKRMRAVLGDSLLASEGETWVEHRKIVKPYFSRTGVKTMMPQVLEALDQFLDGLSPLARSGAVFDLTEEFSKLALLVAAHAFFNTDLSEEVGRITRLMRQGEQYIIDNNPVYIPFWAPTPGHIRVRRVNREINELLLHKIRPEHGTKGGEENVGSALYNALGDGCPVSRGAQERINDEIRTLMFASATIGAVLSTTWMLLGKHPEYMKRLYAEAGRISIDASNLRDPAEDFPFATQLVMEAMRLYSPALAVWRKCTAEDRVGDYVIPKGVSVMTSLFNIHRHPDIWENPEIFDPSRFEPDKVRKRPRHHFMPFGWGPHKCLGDHFSMWVAPMALLRMAQKFDVYIIPDQDIRLRHAVAVVPDKVEARIG